MAYMKDRVLEILEMLEDGYCVEDVAKRFNEKPKNIEKLAYMYMENPNVTWRKRK